MFSGHHTKLSEKKQKKKMTAKMLKMAQLLNFFNISKFSHLGKGTHDAYQIKGLSETNLMMYHTCV